MQTSLTLSELQLPYSLLSPSHAIANRENPYGHFQSNPEYSVHQVLKIITLVHQRVRGGVPKYLLRGQTDKR